MTNPSTVLKGVIQGKTIVLEREPGLPDGQEVTVTVHPVEEPGQKLPFGEGIRRSAGGWAEDAVELDQYVEWVRQQRKADRREIEP